MKRYILPLIFGLTLILNNKSFCQYIYDKPDSLIENGDFINAKIAIKKKIFDLSSQTETNLLMLDKLNIQLGKMYISDKEYANAYDCIKKIVNDSIISSNEIKYKRSLYSYLASDFATCEYEVESVRAEKKDKIDPRLIVLEVLALNEMGKWDQAYKLCKSELYNSWLIDSVKKKECDRFYANLPKLKNEKKAEILNLLLPGVVFFIWARKKME